MVFRICTYEMISGIHVVNILGLNENMSTVYQNTCQSILKWSSSVLEGFQDTGYSFIKN